MTTKPFYKLNLKHSFLREKIDLSMFDQLNTAWFRIAVNLEDYLTPEVIEVFNKTPQPLIHGRIFRGSPGKSATTHVDANVLDNGELSFKNSWAINYVWGSNSHEMIWYEQKLGTTHTLFKVTSAIPNYFIANFNDEDIQEIAREQLSGAYLVRIDIPHALRNIDPVNYRWCFSARNDNFIPWEQAVEQLSPLFE